MQIDFERFVNFKDGMRRLYCCLLMLSLMSFCGQRLYAQDISNGISAKNTATIEFLGHGTGLFSLNYERIFELAPSKYFFTARAGVGYSPFINVGTEKHSGTITVPIVGTLLIGGKKNFVQLGMGYAAAFGHDFIDSTTTTPTIYLKFQNCYSLSLGYRYMWDGFVVQAYPMMLWTSNPSHRFSVLGGVSMGFAF